MKNKIWAVLGYAFLLTLFSAPFLFLYYFLTDPVNAIVLAIGSYLWLIMVVIPGILVLVILWGFFVLIKGFLYSVWALIKSVFQ